MTDPRLFAQEPPWADSSAEIIHADPNVASQIRQARVDEWSERSYGDREALLKVWDERREREALAREILSD